MFSGNKNEAQINNNDATTYPNVYLPSCKVLLNPPAGNNTRILARRGGVKRRAWSILIGAPYKHDLGYEIHLRGREWLRFHFIKNAKLRHGLSDSDFILPTVLSSQSFYCALLNWWLTDIRSVRYTNDISTVMETHTLFLAITSLQVFVHDTTPQLLCHVIFFQWSIIEKPNRIWITNGKIVTDKVPGWR